MEEWVEHKRQRIMEGEREGEKRKRERGRERENSGLRGTLTLRGIKEELCFGRALARRREGRRAGLGAQCKSAEPQCD